MLARTRVNRARLLADFDNWLAERGRSLDGFVTAAPPDVLGLNTALVAFGHELVDAGRPYWIYSETVNGVAATPPFGGNFSKLGPRLPVACHGALLSSRAFASNPALRCFGCLHGLGLDTRSRALCNGLGWSYR